MTQPCRPAPHRPSRLHRRGVALLNQQCWLWGQDVKRERGNLLLEHGFTRLRPPRGESGASQYSLELGNGERVRLWGFGIYFGVDQGVYLNRFEFVPRLAVWKDAWQASEMAALQRSRDWSLALPAFRWIAAYEAWVLQRFGPGYRRSCLAGWRDPVEDSPHRLAEMWLALAHEWQDVLTQRSGRATLRHVAAQGDHRVQAPEGEGVRQRE